MAKKYKVGDEIVLQPEDKNYFVIFAAYMLYQKAGECIRIFITTHTIAGLNASRKMMFDNIYRFYPSLKKMEIAVLCTLPKKQVDNLHELKIAVLGEK